MEQRANIVNFSLPNRFKFLIIPHIHQIWHNVTIFCSQN